MDLSRVSEKLAEEFVENPLNFVTEEDLRIRFIELMKDNLNEEKTVVNRSRFLEDISEGAEFEPGNRYKQTYWEKIRKSGDKIDRVHTEVSVEKGKRIDVVVFKEKEDEDKGIDVEWVQQGSKRYDSEDLDAAIELKFVKNKRYFPTETGFNPEGEKISNIKNNLNLEENSLYKGNIDDEQKKGDIDELSSLPDHVDKYLIIFSNNNYLYQGEEGDKHNNNFKTYNKVGEAARKKIRNLGKGKKGNCVNILYAHPFSDVNDFWMYSEIKE